MPAELFPVSLELVDDSSEEESPVVVTPIWLKAIFGDWQIISPLFESSDLDDSYMDASPVVSVKLVAPKPDSDLVLQRLQSLRSFHQP